MIYLTESSHEERIRNLEGRMGIVETKVDSIKEDIKEIKTGQDKLLWWIIGTMGTVLISILLTIVTMVLMLQRG